MRVRGNLAGKIPLQNSPKQSCNASCLPAQKENSRMFLQINRIDNGVRKMSITQMSTCNEVPKINQHLVDKCPECASKNLVHDYDSGETICGDCGLVLYEQMMDKGPEWRAFTQEEKTSRSRVGMPTSYSIHDKGLSTAISQVDRDAFGRKLPIIH